MTQAYTESVTANANTPSVYLRLGSYVSGEDGFPSNYAGNKTDSDGILMTTSGGFSLVSASPGYLETAENVDVSVTDGNLSLTAGSSLQVTAKSLYLEAGDAPGQDSSPPTVAAGKATIKTSDFHSESFSGDVIITCPKGGYETTSTLGFSQTWGNVEKSNGSSYAVVWTSLIDLPIGIYPSVSIWRLKVRLQEMKMAVSATTAAAFKGGFDGTKIGKSGMAMSIAQILVVGHLVKAGSKLFSSSSKGVSSDSNGVDVGKSTTSVDAGGPKSEIAGVGHVDTP